VEIRRFRKPRTVFNENSFDSARKLRARLILSATTLAIIERERERERENNIKYIVRNANGTTAAAVSDGTFNRRRLARIIAERYAASGKSIPLIRYHYIVIILAVPTKYNPVGSANVRWKCVYDICMLSAYLIPHSIVCSFTKRCFFTKE